MLLINKILLKSAIILTFITAIAIPLALFSFVILYCIDGLQEFLLPLKEGGFITLGIYGMFTSVILMFVLFGLTYSYTNRFDRRFFISLFPEEGPEICKQDGCIRKRIISSKLCALHHYEMIKKKPCPWSDTYDDLSKREKTSIKNKAYIKNETYIASGNYIALSILPMVVSIFVFFSASFYLDSVYNSKERTIYKRNKEILVSSNLLDKLKSMPIQMLSKDNRPRQPYIIATTDLTDSDLPDLKNIKFSDNNWPWIASIQKEFGENQNFTITQINSVVIIAESWRKTGRTLKLDVGSAPEAKHTVRLFVLDIHKSNIVWASGIYKGDPPSLPIIGRPGGGTIYVTVLNGERIDLSKIKQIIKSIPWQ